MKTCGYCGKENEDRAEKCSECGTELKENPAPPGASAEHWERIAVVNSEAEAERLELELNNREIPHVMRSYGDSALDGLYQLGHGWGQVEGPEEHKAMILSMLQDIRQTQE